MKLFEIDEYMEDVKKLSEIALPWDKFYNKSIIISGATGLIGGFLIDVIMKLNESGLNCKIYAVCRSKKRAKERFSYCFESDMFEFVQHDISVPLIKEDIGVVDYVLHLASNTHPRQYSSDPIGTITTNIFGTYNMLEFAMKHKATRCLLASSVEIYGENRGDVEGFDELYCGYIDSNTMRAGYPESKRCSESLCQAYIKQKGMDIVIARLARTYGPTTEVVFASKDGNESNAALNRDELWRTQTPHAYKFNELWDIHNKAIADGVVNMVASCSLMQKYGYTTYFSKGSEKNIKITTVEDIEIFKALLNAKNDEGIKKQGVLMKLIESNLYKADLEKTINNMDLSELEEKSVFVTGGLGLICSAVVDLLLTYGRTEIYVGARNLRQFQERYDGFDRVHFVQYDALSPLNFDIKPDFIIHGAGIASPELYTSKPVETVLSNFDGLHSLLEYAKNNCIKKLLYISSSEVYGKMATDDLFIEGQYGEVDIDNIRSSYAIAKRASEMLCKAYWSEFGLNSVMVRPGHVYGPSAKRIDKRISSDFAFKAASGENLEMKSSGMQKRSYCYSLDCAAQILTVLLKGEGGQAYNVGHDEITTVKEMAKIYAKAGNVELIVAEPTEEELKVFNPMNNSSLDNSKVKGLGYKDTFTVKDGLTHTVRILQEIQGVEN